MSKILDYTIFGKNLKTARFLKQWSQNDLAKAAEITPLKRISLFEEARGRPKLEEVYAICNALGQPIDMMINKEAKIIITF